MSNPKKADVDTESILITLDQLGQTIDIMTSVVTRLRHYVTTQAEHQPEKDHGSTMQSGSHTLH